MKNGAVRSKINPAGVTEGGTGGKWEKQYSKREWLTIFQNGKKDEDSI